MTVTLESSPTTAVAEGLIQPADFEAPPNWARAAVRAHALLSQTMPDEEIDELVDAAVAFDRATFLPPFLFG